MKMYQLSDDKKIVVKKNQGQPLVTIRQNNTDKTAEFTLSRYLSDSNTISNFCDIVCLFHY